MSSLFETPAQKVWEKKLGPVLEKHGLAGVYLFIVTTAQSMEVLKALHEYLHVKAILPADLFDELKEFWRAFQENKGANWQWAMRVLTGTHDLTKYYLELLQDREQFPTATAGHLRDREVYSSVEGLNFRVSYHGVEFPMECRRTNDGYYQVIVDINKDRLSESLTHSLLSLNPPPLKWPQEFGLGVTISLVFTVQPDEKLNSLVENKRLIAHARRHQLIDESASTNREGEPALLAKSGFTDALLEKLRPTLEADYIIGTMMTVK